MSRTRQLSASKQLPELLLAQPNVFDDFFEEGSADVAGVHWDCGEHLSANRIGEIPVASFLVNGDEARVLKRSGDVGCRARRQPAHAVAGTSSVMPREAPRTGRLSTGIFLPALARASR